MTDLEKDLDMQRRTMAIMNYYKLIYIERLTFDKCYDTFTMLGGLEAIDKLVEDNEEGYISFDSTNYKVIARFEHLVNSCVNGNVSISEPLKKELKHNAWLQEVVEYVSADDEVADTIVKNASTDVYQKFLKSIFEKRKNNEYRNCAMKEKLIGACRK